jgi:hypothetical protein
MMETRRDGTPTDQLQQRIPGRTTSPSASASTNKSSQVAPPSITMPKAGGAILGIAPNSVNFPLLLNASSYWAEL